MPYVTCTTKDDLLLKLCVIILRLIETIKEQTVILVSTNMYFVHPICRFMYILYSIVYIHMPSKNMCKKGKNKKLHEHCALNTDSLIFCSEFLKQT